jgi:hypothetical protein
MSQKELVELAAESFTMGAIASGFAVKPLRNKHRAQAERKVNHGKR